MKKIILISGIFLFLVCAVQSVSAQAPTLASDFTLTDCNGTEHNLFSDLNKGDVVAIEFVMGCTPCIQGRKALAKMETQFELSNPGQFHLYTFGYSSSVDCSSIQSWMSTNEFAGTCFGGVDTVISAYGAEAGMPTICIVGGVDHKVLYWKSGFSNKDTTAIKTAISQMLQSQSSVSSTTNSNESLTVYPNPSSLMASLKINCLKEGVRKVILFDAKGTKILSIFDGRLTTGEHTVDFSTKDLTSGTYYIHVTTGEQSTVVPLTVVH